MRTRLRSGSLPAAALLVFGFLVWTCANAASAHDKGLVPGIVPIAAICLPFAAGAFVRAGRPGFAFTATAASIALLTLTMFLNLYPRVIVSSTSNAFSPTIFSTSSSHYTLTVMSVVALVFTPIVLALPDLDVLGLPRAARRRRRGRRALAARAARRARRSAS